MKRPAVDSRVLLAWGVVALVMVMLLVVLLAPYWTQYGKYNAEIVRDSRVLQKLQNIVGEKQRIVRAYSAFEKEGVQGLVYSADQSPTQISLDIQKRLTGIVSENGAVVQTVAPRTSKLDNYSAAGVRINFIGSLGSLIGVLHDVDSAKPLVIVEEMGIKQQWQRRARGRRGGSKQPVGEQKLQVSLTVTSYASTRSKGAK